MENKNNILTIILLIIVIILSIKIFYPKKEVIQDNSNIQARIDSIRNETKEFEIKYQELKRLQQVSDSLNKIDTKKIGRLKEEINKLKEYETKIKKDVISATDSAMCDIFSKFNY